MCTHYNWLGLNRRLGLVIGLQQSSCYLCHAGIVEQSNVFLSFPLLHSGRIQGVRPSSSYLITYNLYILSVTSERNDGSGYWGLGLEAEKFLLKSFFSQIDTKWSQLRLPDPCIHPQCNVATCSVERSWWLCKTEWYHSVWAHSSPGDSLSWCEGLCQFTWWHIQTTLCRRMLS